ncbi:MAG: hypothetical protein MJZ54_00115 [Bacteroidaceae bacterium]|nr:hypothetical protein [Bacteroidaceae bacterium]
MLTAALPLHVGAQTLFFDDQQGPDAASNWVVKELKDFEVGPPAMQGSLKVEYIKKPEPTIATRQGSKVIGTIPGKRKETMTTISWDAFHEHKTERTSTEEIVELGDLCPAVNGHMLVRLSASRWNSTCISSPPHQARARMTAKTGVR